MICSAAPSVDAAVVVVERALLLLAAAPPPDGAPAFLPLLATNREP